MTLLDSQKTYKNNLIELFGSDSKKSYSVLVIGVFHGDEPQGDFLIREYLNKNPDSNILFIPCLNPDGKILKKRTNLNGVDLNRNFPTFNWKLLPKNEYFGGKSPASEIETQFLIKIIDQYNPKLILTLHAPYKIVNYDGEAKDISKKISKIIGYPIQKDIGYPTPGSFGTWAGLEKNIPTITLELDEEISPKELAEPMFEIFTMLENE